MLLIDDVPMPVNAIDHINIITDKLDQTIQFYASVLDLRYADTPAAAKGFKGAWMYDSADNAIVHIIWKNPDSEFGTEHEPGQPTAAVHHVAFSCSDYDSTIAKLDRMAVEYRASGINHLGVRQIFIKDPNNINVELNFSAE